MADLIEALAVRVDDCTPSRRAAVVRVSDGAELASAVHSRAQATYADVLHMPSSATESDGGIFGTSGSAREAG